MDIFALEVWDDEGAKCSFYTVRNDGANESETDLFFEKYNLLQNYKQATQELLSFIIYAIGENHGAIDELFNRDENEVVGLPLQGKRRIQNIGYHFPEFPLRLYALRISTNIVVLFNGGINNGPTNQSSSLHLEWRAACEFAKRINAAIREKTISINENGRKLNKLRWFG